MSDNVASLPSTTIVTNDSATEYHLVGPIRAIKEGERGSAEINSLGGLSQKLKDELLQKAKFSDLLLVTDKDNRLIAVVPGSVKDGTEGWLSRDSYGTSKDVRFHLSDKTLWYATKGGGLSGKVRWANSGENPPVETLVMKDGTAKFEEGVKTLVEAIENNLPGASAPIRPQPVQASQSTKEADEKAKADAYAARMKEAQDLLRRNPPAFGSLHGWPYANPQKHGGAKSTNSR